MKRSDPRASGGAIRGAVILAVAVLLAGALAITPALGAKKAFTKRKALNLFYSKAQADARFLDQAEGDSRYTNSTEKASDAELLDGTDSTGFLGTGAILVQAQDDPTGSTSVTSTADVTVSTVSITAPSAGFLIISGQATVDNDTGSLNEVELTAELDGDEIKSDLGFSTHVGLQDDTSPGSRGTPSLTLTRPVAAGLHTVTLEVDGQAQPYTAEAQELTVLFVPTGGVA